MAPAVDENMGVGIREHFELLLSIERQRTDAQHAELLRALTASEDFSRRLNDAHATAHEREHNLQDQAIVKATASMEQRLQGMNEFRDQLRDQAGTFAPRELMESRLAAMDSKIDAAVKHNATRISVLEGKEQNLSGRLAGIIAAMGVVFILIQIGLRFL